MKYILVASFGVSTLVETTPNEVVAEKFALEPPMALDGLHGDPTLRVVVQHSRYQILERKAGFLAELTPKLVGFLPKHPVEINCWEGIFAHDHHEEYDT